ncbi:MAG: hypothetical protein M3123_05305 [Actinomycetota bacterium]|nr:hypothetical protein [Actinomycetota bacterium]
MLLYTAAERSDLFERTEIRQGPEFLFHNQVANRHWDKLASVFAPFQLLLYDEEADAVVGKGFTIPFAWDGRPETLPDEGFDGVLEAGVALAEQGRKATALSALAAVIEPQYQGRGLSTLLVDGMRSVAVRHALVALVAPVRPTWKERYPLTPLERYARWRREDGSAFDPWIRVHERLGGEIVRLAARSFTVEGTVAHWEEWTGLVFPESGDYIVKGALVPVTIDREADVGRYVEPNVWMRHPV